MPNQHVNKVALATGEILIDLTGDTVTPADLAYGVTAHDMSGAPIEGTSTKDSDTSGDTAVVGEILSGKTAHARGAQLTGTMPNNGAVSASLDDLTPYVVPAGYHDGTGTVGIDSTEAAKVIPGNIKLGVELLGVTGEYGGEPISVQSKSATPTFSQQVILPDSGYDYLSQVTVAAIPVTRQDNAAGGVTVTIGSAA